MVWMLQLVTTCFWCKYDEIRWKWIPLFTHHWCIKMLCKFVLWCLSKMDYKSDLLWYVVVFFREPVKKGAMRNPLSILFPPNSLFLSGTSSVDCNDTLTLAFRNSNASSFCTKPFIYDRSSEKKVSVQFTNTFLCMYSIACEANVILEVIILFKDLKWNYMTVNQKQKCDFSSIPYGSLNSYRTLLSLT